MKNQFLGIFFYLLYLLAMVRPVLPIIEYYANYDYIATVLCENRDKPYLECNGKCYLEKQLKEINHDNHEHKSTIPQINLEDYPVSPIDQYGYKISNINTEYLNQVFGINQISSDYYTSILKPPPKLVL